MIRSKFKKAELDKVIKLYRDSALPAIATHSGARSATLLVNRDTGDAISIAFYDNETAAQAFAPKAQQLAEALSNHLDEPAAKREIYEVAISTQSEAKAVAERGLEAFNAHDLEALARDAASDVEGFAPGGMKLKGPQAIKEFNQNFVTAFPDARVEAKNLFAAGKTVIVEGIFRGTHNGTLKTPMGDVPATGRKVEGEYVQIIDVDRGLVKRSSLIYDQVQLMTQLGMAPAPPPQVARTAGR
ncbi:MAG TPA: ester cyclase [Candidatus Dormibacteraeota bacterium]|nr:ester cyclase [Candidatus Dormibacteraeota bacterium]